MASSHGRARTQVRPAGREAAPLLPLPARLIDDTEGAEGRPVDGLSGVTPLVLLHGVLGSGNNWAPVAKAVSRRCLPAVTVDLRNHGTSPHAAPMTYDAMVADLLRLLHHDLGVNSAIVAGHSMGGKVGGRGVLAR